MMCNCKKEMKDICEKKSYLLSSLNCAISLPGEIMRDIPNFWWNYLQICSRYINLRKNDRIVLRLINRYYEGSACYFSIAMWVKNIVEEPNYFRISGDNLEGFIECVSSYLHASFGNPEDENNTLIKMIEKKNEWLNKSNIKFRIRNLKKSRFRSYKIKFIRKTFSNEIVDLKEEINSNKEHKDNFKLEQNILNVGIKKSNRIHKRITISKDDEELKSIEIDFKVIVSESENIQEKYRKEFIKTRIGQGKFRESLIKKHGCKCSLCGLDIEELLVASHIKEYANCSNNEHIDLKNGLLLCPNHDKLFDKHLISFDSNGKIIIANIIDSSTYKNINIDKDKTIDKDLFKEEYMDYHRKKLIHKSVIL